MKKFFFLTATAAVMFASCAKVEKDPAPAREIDFQTANYLTKATTGAVYGTDNTFGTYSFTDDGKDIIGNNYVDLMVNQSITHQTAMWKADRVVPYFWPETGYLDFISYSPYIATADPKPAGIPTITETTLSWTGYTVVTDHDADLMYADKAVNLNGAVNNITDDEVPESNFSGVPTLFHHALAQVKFVFDISTESDANYDVVVTGVSLDGVYTKGNLELTLDLTDSDYNSTLNEGADDNMIPWVLPANVWSHPSEGMMLQTFSGSKLLTQSPQTLLPSSGTGMFYVLPQTLVDDKQKVVVDFTVYLQNGKDDPSQKVSDYEWTTSLRTDALSAWEINKQITYTVSINPPFNEITFDPAVADWSTPGSGTITFD